MVDYIKLPIIVSNMKAIGPTTSEELYSKCIIILKMHENIKVPHLKKLLNQNGG